MSEGKITSSTVAAEGAIHELVGIDTKQMHYKLGDISNDINRVDSSGKQVGAKDVMGGKEAIIEYDYSLKETLNKDAKKFVKGK
jgi:hypothetical protein